MVLSRQLVIDVPHNVDLSSISPKSASRSSAKSQSSTRTRKEKDVAYATWSKEVNTIVTKALKQVEFLLIDQETGLWVLKSKASDYKFSGLG